MRGKPTDKALDVFVERITPADAGKTCGCGCCCGCSRGSPPRMRGKPGYTDEAKKPLGITPADAGKTYNYLFGC